MRKTTFTTLNRSTKRAQSIINAYNNANATTLDDVYPTHYSSAKASAYKECVAMMNDNHGNDLKIIGACTTNFSVSFTFVNDNGKKCLAYLTHCNNFVIELNDDDTNDDWVEKFSKDYDGLCDTTKKHLANACPHITSREQAEGIMQMSKMFDILFRMNDNNKGTN